MSATRVDWRQGAQLGAAVLLSHLASQLLALPEAFWSVMSVLIVMRADSAGTLAAGWERLRSTGGGALVGLAGVWALEHGLPRDGTTLAVTAAMAAASGAVPGWRGAPIAALIVLGSRAGVGHSALTVAALRVEQIAIGVSAALLVAFVASRLQGEDRLRSGCAKVLRGHAARWAGRAPDDAALAERLRTALGRLGALAEGADQGTVLVARLRCRAAAQGAQRERVKALVQSCHHADSIARLLEGADAALKRRVSGAVARAFRSASDALIGAGSLELEALEAMADTHGSEPALAHIAGPARLLSQDLRAVCAATP